jgi:hypothetical protein
MSFFEKGNEKTHQAPQLLPLIASCEKNTYNEITVDSLWIKIFLDINVFFFEAKINATCVYFKLSIMHFFGLSYEYPCLTVLEVDVLASNTVVSPAIHMCATIILHTRPPGSFPFLLMIRFPFA